MSAWQTAVFADNQLEPRLEGCICVLLRQHGRVELNGHLFVQLFDMQAAFASRLRAQSGGYLIRSAASGGRQASQDPDRVGKSGPGSVRPVHSNTWKAQAFRSTEMSDGVTTSGVDGLNGSTTSTAVRNGVNGNGEGNGKSAASSVIDFMMLIHSLKVSIWKKEIACASPSLGCANLSTYKISIL